jgi:DNA end-binding protein Ku
MAVRANWKGVLKVGELTCPVALFTATSTAERVAFHLLNRKTGHRLHREFVDGETGKPVESGDQVKGYDTGNGNYVILEPDEIAAALPDSDKTLTVDAFVACDDIDDTYFDRPYFLAPSQKDATEAFLLRAHDDGLVATTLNFDYEVRSSDEAFDEIPTVKITAEMLDLAQHIIKTKMGSFDPAAIEDRYEDAVAELVKAKIEGRKIVAPKRPKAANVVGLLDALRQSATGAKPAAKKPAAPKRKAG